MSVYMCVLIPYIGRSQENLELASKYWILQGPGMDYFQGDNWKRTF